MIKKVPLNVTHLSVEKLAEAVGLTMYSAIVRGKDWIIVRGVNANGNAVVALSSPVRVEPTLAGMQTLLGEGFPEVDALLALGLHRNDFAQMKKQAKAKAKRQAAMKQTRGPGSVLSFDDL